MHERRECACVFMLQDLNSATAPLLPTLPTRLSEQGPLFFSPSCSKRSFYSGSPHAAVKWQYRQTTEQQLKTTEENKVTRGCESSITADESNYFLTLKITLDQVENAEEDRVLTLVVTFTITGGQTSTSYCVETFFLFFCLALYLNGLAAFFCSRFFKTANWIWKVKCQKLALKQVVGEWRVCPLYSTRPGLQVTFGLGLRVNHNAKSEKNLTAAAAAAATRLLHTVSPSLRGYEESN